MLKTTTFKIPGLDLAARITEIELDEEELDAETESKTLPDEAGGELSQNSDCSSA